MRILNFNQFINENSSYDDGMNPNTWKKKKTVMKKRSKMDDDDPEAYEPLPGDSKAVKDGKVKLSTSTKKYREKFQEENELLEKELVKDKSPIDDEKIESALKKKSEETGVSVKYLRVVMRRGMAAWKSGHRPGANQQQWAYARLNSFLTAKSTTWGSPKKDPKGGADSDVAQEIIKAGEHTKIVS